MDRFLNVKADLLILFNDINYRRRAARIGREKYHVA